MAVDQKPYFAFGVMVIRDEPDGKHSNVARAVSGRAAKRIANALNLYKVRRRKSAEKSK